LFLECEALQVRESEAMGGALSLDRQFFADDIV